MAHWRESERVRIPLIDMRERRLTPLERHKAMRALRDFERLQELVLIFRIVAAVLFAAFAALVLLDGCDCLHLFIAACFAGCFLAVLKGDWTCRL